MSENGCKWYFGPEGPVKNGPTNPSKGTFSSSPDIDMVREALQNSLDAKIDPNDEKPVIVKFSFTRMRSSEFPAFFALRDHIQASLDAYPDNDRAKEKFPTMISYLSNKSGGYAEYVDLLTIGDYNTKGMPYEKGKDSLPFYAFLHSIGLSVDKPEESGGSNGLGKETLYNRSAIKALLISTRTTDGQVVFQGATKLATHKDPHDPNNPRASAFGFYGQDKDEPITIESDIPECFRRQEPGTDIHVIGLLPFYRDAIKTSIIRAVLNHFWLAVHRKKIVVEVDGTLINHASIPQLLKEHFPEATDKHSIKNYEKWNPRPYFNAVVNVEAKKEKTAFEEKDSELLGHMRFFLDWSEDNLPKKVVYMRQPRMVIYKGGKPSYPNFAAVFVCDHDIGNRALRCVEPPAHNEWDIKYFEGADADKARYRKCISEVNNFVVSMLDKHFRGESIHNEIIIPGLAELLPDIEKSDDGVPGTVGSGSSDGLQPSGKIASKETAAPVSFIDDHNGGEGAIIRPVHKGLGSSLIDDTGVKSDDTAGRKNIVEVTHVPQGGGGGGGGGGSGGKDTSAPHGKTTTEKAGATTMVQVKVLYTPICHVKDGVLLHRMVLKPDPKSDASRYKNVSIFLKTGSDNNSQDTTPIKNVQNLPSGAVLHGNEIRALDISSPLKLDVQFIDTIKHSIKVVAYASK